MKPIENFQRIEKTGIRYVLTDIDDTLTVNGRLPAAVFTAMEALQQSGIRVIPITGRPAGWCDHIARMWPVDGLVGENGAFYFRYDDREKRMIRRYWKSTAERISDRVRLDAIREKVLAGVPGCAVAPVHGIGTGHPGDFRSVWRHRQNQLHPRKRVVRRL
jgi:trehalose-6-phosphatase